MAYSRHIRIDLTVHVWGHSLCCVNFATPTEANVRHDR